MKNEEALTDIDTDQQENGIESFVTIDRDAAARQGMTNKDVDNALYDAFGQRQVATIYDALNQYHVVMEAMPQFAQSPVSLQGRARAGQRQQRRAARRRGEHRLRRRERRHQRQSGLARTRPPAPRSTRRRTR